MPSALKRLYQHARKISHTCASSPIVIHQNLVRPYSSSKLAEIGKFEIRQPDEQLYLPGQPFLHRIFGYRGVTLFPWLARIHDIDLRKQYSDESGYLHSNDSQTTNIIGSDENSQKEDAANRRPTPRPASSSSSSSSAIRYHPYYQVLIDTRDCPYVSNRTQTEAVTFLGHPDNSKSVYSIKGLDYVAHEDILPYTSLEEQPIHHELHKKLFKYNPEPTTPPSSSSSPSTTATTITSIHNNNSFRFSPTELLDSWVLKHPWLELSRVYRETTENVRVTVIPFYLGHTTIEDTSFHWWRYCVRLENFSDTSVQLRERHWKIFSQTNMLQTIKGRGVVGVEPLLSKSEPAYQYSSHVNLQDKSGHMWGTFKMQREDGHTFECRIPPFSLESSIDPPIKPPTSKRSRDNSHDHQHQHF